MIEYLRRTRAREALDGFEPAAGLVVEKERIAADGDYNLGGDRYRSTTVIQAEWPMVQLGDVSEIFNGITSRKADYRNVGLIKVIKVRDFDESKVHFDNDTNGWIDNPIKTKKYLKCGDTLMINAAHSATHVASKIGFLDIEPPFRSLPSGEITIFRASESILPVFLNSIIRSDVTRQALKAIVKGIHIYPRDIRNIEIPLPPVGVQRQIVADIEHYQNVIDGARQLIEDTEDQIQATIASVWSTEKASSQETGK